MQQQQPTSTRSVQGTRVQQELEILRHKQLAKNQRNKFKDCTLTVLPMKLDPDFLAGRLC
jgi:hypothetical protein